jgi:hypothetical protein
MEAMKNMRQDTPEADFQRRVARTMAVANDNPDQFLAIQKQQQEDQKNAFEMQMQIEQFRANQARMKRFEQERQHTAGSAGNGEGATGATGAIGAGSAGSTVGDMDPEVKQAYLNAETPEEAHKIYSEWAQNQAKERAQFLNNPSAFTQQDFFDGQSGQKLTPYEVRDRMMNPSKYAPMVKEAPTANAPSGSSNVSPTIKSKDILNSIKQGVLSNESSGNKVDTSKPGIQGATGQMQITPDTFQTAKNLKLIPSNYDINNPSHNKEAGDALLSYYYDKYNGDVDKVFAAYHGGEGAINKDGSINLGRKDKLGTSIADYISRGRKNAGLDQTEITNNNPTENIPQTEDEYNAMVAQKQNQPAFTGQKTNVASEGAPPKMAYSDYQVQHESQLAGSKKEFEKTGEENAARKSATIIAASNADDNIAANNYLNNIVNQNPKAFGVLQHPTVVSAILNMVESGISAPGVEHTKIPSIDAAVRAAMPGSKESDIVAAQKASQKFALLQLNAAKVVLKGQGSVSDQERLLVARMTGSIENSPAAIRDMLKWGSMRYQYDKSLGNLHDQWEITYPNQSYRQFELTPEYKALKNTYKQQINAFAEKAGNYKAPDVKQTPVAKPAGYDEWKKQQGKS